MARRRKRGAEHRGVTLYSREWTNADGSTGRQWRASHLDPDGAKSPTTGKVKRLHVMVPAPHDRTAETRSAWAAELAKRVRRRRDALDAGAPTKTGRTVEDVIGEYFTLNAPRLRPSTTLAYKLGADELLAFTAARRIVTADALRGEDLEAFRARVLAAPAQRPKEGGKPGERVVTAEARSVPTSNTRLRACRTILEALRRLGLVPMLSRDVIADRLRAEKEPRPVPSPLSPTEARALLRAALRHDAARVEAGGARAYEPVGPFVFAALAGGFRFDELRCLRWARVDLAAHPAGAIVLQPEDVKTHRGRTIDLAVSPALAKLLAVLRLKAGDAHYVFGGSEPWSRAKVENARRRLIGEFGAPGRFTWQTCRETCATVLANAASIFGAASAFREARQLGHSVVVAERHYAGHLHVPPEVRSVEAALAVEAEAAAVVRLAGGEALGLDLEDPAEALAGPVAALGAATGTDRPATRSRRASGPRRRSGG